MTSDKKAAILRLLKRSGKLMEAYKDAYLSGATTPKENELYFAPVAVLVMQGTMHVMQRVAAEIAAEGGDGSKAAKEFADMMTGLGISEGDFKT